MNPVHDDSAGSLILFFFPCVQIMSIRSSSNILHQMIYTYFKHDRIPSVTRWINCSLTTIVRLLHLYRIIAKVLIERMVFSVLYEIHLSICSYVHIYCSVTLSVFISFVFFSCLILFLSFVVLAMTRILMWFSVK